MKILELSIENIRGIKKKITLKPEGNNAVIFGPNGTGKSAVVDAIDFLFTGDISRLTGRGSQEMSLKEHGPHIDAEAKETSVKASIQISGTDKPIVIERRMTNPKTLICSDSENNLIKESLEVAKKGQHVLSRADILKFIETESAKRAEEVQKILNLKKVEDLRKNLGTIRRDADRKLQTDKTNFEKSKEIIKTTMGLGEFSEYEALREVNRCRNVLNGEPIEALIVEKLKEGIKVKTEDEKERLHPDQLKKTLDEVKKLIDKKGAELFGLENNLRSTVKKLKESEKLRKDLTNKKLLEIGISLIDDTGSCPLCLTKWEPGKLEEKLKQRILSAKEAEVIETEIRELSTQIDTEVNKLKEHIRQLTNHAKILQKEPIVKGMEGWSNNLNDWSQKLRDAIEDYPIEEPKEEIKRLMASDKWEDYSKELEEALKGAEESTPEQKAWDTLTALDPMLKRYFEEKIQLLDSEKFAKKAAIASTKYTQIKDEVLESLYNSVKQDFADYYKFIHEADEKDFLAELKSDGARLDFKVDFYGRGQHHPRALHSEGHQDSMGLCLFLALNKKISEGKVKTVILDDVVMSIDSGHRRSICKLLNKHFSNQQFIITTHNRTWARQLRTDSVVKSNNMYEFKSWSVDSGPKFKENADVWDEIREKTCNNEIASASHELREHAEFFYEAICDSLQAAVRYRSDGELELGDYLKGAKKALKDLLKMAKNSANSWNKPDEIAKYEEFETQAKETIDRTQSEHWGVNENIHFSKWADFSKEDFMPIAEAFQDLEDLFKCSTCQSIIVLVMNGQTPVSVKCSCGTVNWNLEEKKKS